MSFPEHKILYETYGQELKELLEIVLSGEPAPFVLPSLPTNPVSGYGHEADPRPA